MRIVRNELVAEGDRISARATDDIEELPVDLVFRSVGYRGVAIEGIPFHERWGVIPNDSGRVTQLESDAPVPGMYVSGWIKRGPSGVIGTNKKDGTETGTAMVEDVAAGAVLAPSDPDPRTLNGLIRSRRPDVVTYGDWTRLDQMELERGEAEGRPRVKFTSRDEVREALSKD